MKAYLLQNPDGTYRQKNGSAWHCGKGAGGKVSEEINLRCLYVSRGSLRGSMNGLLTTSLREYAAYPPFVERPWQLPKEEADKYYADRIRAYEKIRKLPTDAFFALFEKDGYKIIEVEINIP